MFLRPNGINAGYGPMRPYIQLEVLHGAVFTLYERNGVVFELEIYHADSSEMDLGTIKVLVCLKKSNIF